MYKGAGKRILAMAVAVCMVIGLMPETVMAAAAKTYYTYQHGSGSTSGYMEADMAAAVFTVGKSSSGGAEVLDSVSFNVHVNEEGKDASATVSYYINPTAGNPASGTYVCAKPLSNLQEGLNSVEIGMRDQLKAGDTFSVVVSLKGAALAYYGNAAGGQTYLSIGGSWQDANATGQCMAIRAYTYAAGDDGADNRSWLDKLTAGSSDAASKNESAATPSTVTPASLNQRSMVLPVGGYDDIVLNDAEGNVSWKVADTSVAEIRGSGSTAYLAGLADGETTITAVYAGNTYTCDLHVTSSIEDAELIFTPSSLSYDGKAHMVKLTVSLGGKVLEENKNYTVACTRMGTDQSVDTSAGLTEAATYSFTITGKGDYNGSKTLYYVITPKQITDSSITVTTGEWNPDAPEAYVTKVTDTATGKELRLQPTASAEATDAAEAEQTASAAGSAYDCYVEVIRDKDNKITAINVVGCGNYAGTRECKAPQSIAKATLDIDESVIYSGKAWIPDFSVELNGTILSADDFEVTYNPTELINVGEYQVTVTGKNAYWDSIETTFTIKPKDITASDVEIVVSNGSNGAGSFVTITYNGMQLEENTDYTIGRTGNQITITGQGNYTGTYTTEEATDNTFIADIVREITVNPNWSYTGEAITPAVTLVYSNPLNGTLVRDVDYKIIYSNNVNVGTATVTVQGIGKYGGQRTTSFTISPAKLEELEYYFKDASGKEHEAADYKVAYSANLNEMKPEVVVRTKKGVLLTKDVDYTLSYSLDNNASDFNNMSVTVTAIEKTNYTGSKTLNYSVKKQNLKTALESGELTITMQESLSYTGEVQKPRLTLYEGGELLEEGKDYKVSYPSNAKDVGKYNVIITGQGLYTGSISKDFQITRTDVMSLADIQPINAVGDYDGSYMALLWYDDTKENNKLKLALKNSANILLVEGTDYTLSYENITEISAKAKPAKVKITGIGNYVGEREIYYLLAGKLDEYALSLAGTDNITYTGKPIDLKEAGASIAVQKKGTLFTETLPESDYTLSYKDNTNAGTATVTVEALEDALLPSETGCYRYEDSSKKKSDTFTIQKKNIADEDITLKKIAKEYTGNAVALALTDIALTYNGQQLAQDGSAFAILAGSYTNNEPNAEGTPEVSIEGTGNYTGLRQIEFTIRGKSFDGIVAEIESVTYTGEKLEPKITSLKAADGTPLTEGTHYAKPKYYDNIDAGEGKILIKGLGVYTGSTAELTFTIKPRSLASTGADGGTLEAAGLLSSYTYTSQEIKPEVTIHFTMSESASGEKTLQADTDYAITYRDNVNVGKAKLSITGSGNYTGTVEKEFEITPKSIEDTEVTVADIPSQEYVGGMAVRPTPDIAYQWGANETDTYQLTGTDYTVTYTNNKKIGEATATINGTGNFSGTVEKTFHIGTSIADSSKISVSCPDIEKGTVFTYNGKEHKPGILMVNTVTGGTLSQGIDYTVSYKNNIDAGVATVIVEGTGIYAGTAEFTFQIVPMDFAGTELSIYVVNDDELLSAGNYKTTYTGNAIEPELKLMLKRNELSAEGYTVSYTNNVNAGSAAVTVTAKENSNYTGTKTFEQVFTIAPMQIGTGGKTPAKGFTMEKVEPQPVGKNNAKVEPTPKLYFNGTALTVGVDYTYSYENNAGIAKNARVTLTGMGNFAGSVYQVFEICGSIEGAVISVPTEVWYKDFVTKNADGSVTVPSEITFDDKIQVTVSGKTLEQGKDYDVKYSNNSWVGMATVTIKAKGAYAGMDSRQIPIKADLSETTIAIPDQAFTGEELTPIPVIEYYGRVLANGTDFNVAYLNNKEISNQGATAVITGVNQFGGMQEVKFSIKADASTLTIYGVEPSYMYRGTAIKPSVEAKLGKLALEEGIDYTVLFGQNTNVGTHSVVVRGKDGSRYAGLLGQASFEILPWDVANLIVTDASGKGSGIADKEYTGEAITPEVTLTAAIDGRTYTMPEGDYTLAYQNNTECGEAAVTITGSTGNITGSTTATFRILPKSLSVPKHGTDNISVTVTQNSYAYDGTAKEPEVVVTYQFGEGETKCRTLQKDVDYTVNYENNINAGTASVTVTGIGNYTGSRTEKFKIAEKNIAQTVVTFKDGTSYPYMGSTVPVEPELIVKDTDGTELTKDKDYTVSYQNNKACGTATVTLTGKGDFGGTTTASFQIIPHSIDAADVTVAPIPNQSHTGSIVIPEVAITCGEYELILGKDYRLSGTSKDMGSAEVTIHGIGGFSGQRIEAFNIREGIEKAVVTGAAESYPYTGQTLTSEMLGITEVTLNGKPLLEGTDYSFGFAKGSDGVSVGEQTVVLTGINNYGGTKKLTVSITAKNIADADVELSGFAESLPYIDKRKQDITLTWNGITLSKDTDYEVVCEPSDKEDTYVMTVTGKGNYTGVIEKEYAVERAILDTVEVMNLSSSYTYTGKAIKPVPTVKIGDEILTEGEDYKLTYSNNVNAGTAVLLVKGTGKTFSGEKEVTFNILRRSITHAQASEIAAQIYTGSYIEPKVTMTYDGTRLTENGDYILSYNDNRTAGRATVRVTGKGNYNAVKTLAFNIKPCDVTALAITGTSSDTVSLSWKSDGTVTGYEIYRKSPDSGWQLVGSTQKTSYTDEKLSTGTAYSYYVRSYITDKVRGTDYGAKSLVVDAATAK